ncbi:MAG TPA: hypothetical protein VFA26_04255 [Gemmataceae bacterium]|nr:hypothetical protein [Gemmataceae bacterium]
MRSSPLDTIRTEYLRAERIRFDDFGDLCHMHRDPMMTATLGGVRADEETERWLQTQRSWPSRRRNPWYRTSADWLPRTRPATATCPGARRSGPATRLAAGNVQAPAGARAAGRVGASTRSVSWLPFRAAAGGQHAPPLQVG